MKRCFGLAGLVVVVSASAMLGQGAQPKDPCEAMPGAGSEAAKNFLGFDTFDKELRVAITKQDPVALAFLVTYPLRVNDAGGGSIGLNDAAALKTHFQEVFTPAVRKEILEDTDEKTGCSPEGLGYGRGVIWVKASAKGYAIWSVNRDAVAPYKKMLQNPPNTAYVCQTAAHRIVIDTVVGGGLRYRAWNRPRSVTDAPDLEISKGDESFEGTNVCAVAVYTFKKGETTYRVESGLGCGADADGVADEATGRLMVTVGEKTVADSSCY